MPDCQGLWDGCDFGWDGVPGGNNDSISLWMDPALNSDPGPADVSYSGINLDFNKFRFAGWNAATFDLDELRLGTSWQMVMGMTTAQEDHTYTGQRRVERLELLPQIPEDWQLRDWNQVLRDFVMVTMDHAPGIGRSVRDDFIHAKTGRIDIHEQAAGNDIHVPPQLPDRPFLGVWGGYDNNQGGGTARLQFNANNDLLQFLNATNTEGSYAYVIFDTEGIHRNPVDPVEIDNVTINLGGATDKSQLAVRLLLRNSAGTNEWYRSEIIGTAGSPVPAFSDGANVIDVTTLEFWRLDSHTRTMLNALEDGDATLLSVTGDPPRTLAGWDSTLIDGGGLEIAASDNLNLNVSSMAWSEADNPDMQREPLIDGEVPPRVTAFVGRGGGGPRQLLSVLVAGGIAGFDMRNYNDRDYVRESMLLFDETKGIYEPHPIFHRSLLPNLYALWLYDNHSDLEGYRDQIEGLVEAHYQVVQTLGGENVNFDHYRPTEFSK